MHTTIHNNNRSGRPTKLTSVSAETIESLRFLSVNFAGASPVQLWIALMSDTAIENCTGTSFYTGVRVPI